MNATETEIDLLGYLIGANDPSTDRVLRERLPRDPELARLGNRLRHLLEPLAAAKREIEPPADLALKAIGFVAQHVAADEIARRERCPERVTEPLGYTAPHAAARAFPAAAAGGSPVQRRNWFAAIGLALSVLVVLLPGVAAVRAQYRIQACQRNLQQLHESLAVYADNRAGQFPFMEQGRPETHVVAQLRDAGVLPAFAGSCRPDSGHFDYAYTLGFQQEGGPVQPRRQDDPERGRSPLLADVFDTVAQASPNHRHGQNVLYIDGHVDFSRTPFAGVGGDHIYQNWNAQVQPGLSRLDGVLASPDGDGQ